MVRKGVLHSDILCFAASKTPSPQEHEFCEKVIEILRKLTYSTFGREVELSPFGSYANGLAAHGADLDLVITGLLKPDTPEGFFGHKQVLLWQHLELLQTRIINSKSLNIHNIEFIRHARVPILKVALQEKIMLDISINDESSIRAASYVLEKVRNFPPLRPLCLVLKEYLKIHQLGVVKDGGLGGYALTNMMIAHLQETVKVAATEGRPMALHDYGELLMSFFLRFGRSFSPDEDAVCVRKGGVLRKKWVLAHPIGQGHWTSTPSRNSHGRWLIENPITGRNVAQGSYRMETVMKSFSFVYGLLAEASKRNIDLRLSSVFDLRAPELDKAN